MSKTILTALLSLVSCFATAQDTMLSKYPCAILLQVSSEHNRIAALSRSGNSKYLEQIVTDAAAVKNAMLNDFRDNFHYCPVYFFIDTNEELVRSKQFTNALITLDSMPLQHSTPCLDSGRYLIVYYGTPETQSNRKNSANADDTYGPPAGRGLVILDDQFRQLSYIYKLRTAELFGDAKKKKNFYSSPRFDIQYYPLADRLDERLRERKNQTDKIRIRK